MNQPSMHQLRQYISMQYPNNQTKTMTGGFTPAAGMPIQGNQGQPISDEHYPQQGFANQSTVAPVHQLSYSNQNEDDEVLQLLLPAVNPHTQRRSPPHQRLLWLDSSQQRRYHRPHIGATRWIV
jgi:hypothetical protein